MRHHQSFLLQKVIALFQKSFSEYQFANHLQNCVPEIYPQSIHNILTIVLLLVHFLLYQTGIEFLHWKEDSAPFTPRGWCLVRGAIPTFIDKPWIILAFSPRSRPPPVQASALMSLNPVLELQRGVN